MINADVGDFLKHTYWGAIHEIIEVEEDKFYIKGTKGTYIERDSEDYIVLVNKQLYEQQKQRADELESLLYTYKENAKSIPDLIEQIQESNKRADELENHVKNLEMDSYLSRERADIYKNKSQRLDNNWSELKEKTIETYSTLKKEKSILAQYIGSILCVMDELEGKENVFETVQSLENNNA